MTIRYTLAFTMALASLAACAGDQASEAAQLSSNLEAPGASASVLAQEQAARTTAALGIDAQPRDVQKRYYQALLMTKQQSANTMQQVVNDLGTQEEKAASAQSADSASLSKQRGEAQMQLDKNQQRVNDLQAKLATF